MLTELYIKNYALIEELRLTPHQSLNIITGETGAGKSIMLGAIGLLMGNRADTKALLRQDEKCIVEATFLVWAYNLKGLFAEFELDFEERSTLRREISPQGKSRAFINDTPVTLDALRAIGTRLLDVHSQHDNLLLGDNRYQLHVIDAYAANTREREAYHTAYRAYQQAKSNYERLEQEYKAAQKEYDYHHFLWDELTKASLQAHEQADLEQELELLERTEEVKTKLQKMLSFLANGEPAVLDEMKVISNQLSSIAELSPVLSDIRNRLESCRLELQDVVKEAEREEEAVEFSPVRVEEINARLNLIYHLQKKHQTNSIAELLALQEALEAKVRRVQNFDEDLQAAHRQLLEDEEDLRVAAEALSQTRHRIIAALEQDIKVLLADLGMPNGILSIQIHTTAPTPEGIDLASFLFSANKGIAPQEIARVASGGEFSRLMLALKYVLAGKTALPTIIFDEIDTGISGEIALKMGSMFRQMSAKHQLIAITHLPQIAASGNHHYFVYKDDSAERTISRIRQLNDDDRVREIAQMMSGANPSESALASAKELLVANK